MTITITIASPFDGGPVTQRISSVLSEYLSSINIGHAMMSDGVVTAQIGDRQDATIVIVNTRNKE